MLQGFIVKKILELVFKKIMAAQEIKRMRKYVEEDNELDIKVRKLTKEVNKLKKIAHIPADFVCVGCGCKAKRKGAKHGK